MSHQEVWPPPPTSQTQPPSQQASFVWPNPFLLFLTLMIGLWEAWHDIHHTSSDPGGYWDVLDVITLAALAFLQPRYAWLWATILTACMTAVHVWAIQHGYRHPYVERSTPDAIIGCGTDLLPNLIVVYAAVALRVIVVWIIKGVGRAKKVI